jgi:hypothetical protein
MELSAGDYQDYGRICKSLLDAAALVIANRRISLSFARPSQNSTRGARNGTLILGCTIWTDVGLHPLIFELMNT